ncbi:MAG TPA: sugar phosphate nucleotidyltransferase [Candidatus Peribacteraceae bacterium]|nr:sugar phosphate nucleotidyltransferase [Candidatus Peribacteraceae bacterium]
MQLTQAILPVAGLGTRFLPWTKVVPKELLPIGNQPIIALLVDTCLSVGITDICFVISHGKEQIPQYFYADPELEKELASRGKGEALAQLAKYDNVNFHVVYQDKQLGDGHAILQAKDWVKSDQVAILFGDDLIVWKENGIQQLVNAFNGLDHARDSAVLCLENVPLERVSKYGIVDVDEAQSNGRLRKVKGLVEKPKPEDAPSTLGIIGEYLIPRSTFDVLPTVKSGQGGEIRLIDALIAQLSAIDIYGYEVEGKRLDTGTPEGYKEAVQILG